MLSNSRCLLFRNGSELKAEYGPALLRLHLRLLFLDNILVPVAYHVHWPSYFVTPRRSKRLLC